ncbi:glycosyltransferase [Rahnella sp. PD12R]|uniref:glycosyltransferase n=1 Tax=Rahnella sp. PD12R TaxID=2855688 RepID=UPI001C4873C5|nr:glycosyltransferase [Rahnella sp. PD12R]MBV6821301.1 glycosyltransferase [Rahnella sp. PD12R]
MIYYDITDIINHAKFSTKVSGIQRVVLEGMKGLTTEHCIFFISPISGKNYEVKGLDSVPLDDLTPFINLWIYADIYKSSSNKTAGAYFKKLSSRGRKFKALYYMHTLVSNVPVLSTILDELIKSRLKSRIFKNPGITISEINSFKSGATVALFGGVWNFQEHYDELFKTQLKNLKKIFMVYDMIPIVSGFVPDELKSMFKKYIPFVLANANTVIVNSHSCKEDLTSYAENNGFNIPDIKVVHLSHKLPVKKNDIGLHADITYPLRTRKLQKEVYAFCLGSIESRKNHVNLILTWIKFFNSDEYANQKLVIAGKWLWDTDELAKLLTYTGHVSGSVIIVHDANDEEIAELYRNCRFTVYPSHYEGWGLPLGESLAVGKPCLHFDISSMKEAGYGLTNYVNYLDYADFYEQFRKLMVDDAFYNACVDNIERNKGILRSWNDFSSDISTVFINETD